MRLHWLPLVAPLLLAIPVTHCGDPVRLATGPTVDCREYALGGGGARFFAMQPRIDMRTLTTPVEYRAWIDALVNERVTPCLATDHPNVIVFPEDVALPASFLGSRAERARSQSDSFGAFFNVLAGYQNAASYYDDRLTGLGFGEKLNLSVTDTVWRAFFETMQSVARRTGAWVVASANVSGTIEKSTDDILRKRLGDPDVPSPYVYVAKDRAVYNTAFVFNPGGDIAFQAHKPYLVETEEKDLQLAYGRMRDVTPFSTPFARLGILTSKDAWMPDVVDRLAIQGADTFIQPEAFSGWTIEELPGDWLPEVFSQSAWSATQKYGGFRAAVVPHLTGNLFDQIFDGQAAIVVDDPGAQLGYVGMNMSGFRALAPWAAPDPGTGSLADRRSALRDVGNALKPGGSRENQYVRTAVAADVDPRGAFPTVTAGPAGVFGASHAVADAATGEQRNVAVGGDGATVLAAWEDTRGGTAQIQLSTFTAGTFAAPMLVDSGNYDQLTPSVAVSGAHVWLAWTEHHPTERHVVVAHSTDGGATFATAMPLGTPIGADEWLPQIVADGATAWIAYVANDAENERIRVARTTDGTTFAITDADAKKPAFVAPNTRNNQWSPALARTPKGELVAAWVDFRDYQWDLYGSRSTDGGVTFGEAARLPADTDTSRERLLTDPVLIALADGSVREAWTDVRKRLAKAVAAMTGPAGELVLPGASQGSQYRPALAVVGGNVVVAWQDFGTRRNRIVLGKDSVVDDSGDGVQCFRPRIADAGGKALVVWEDTRAGRRQLRFALEP